MSIFFDSADRSGPALFYISRKKHEVAKFNFLWRPFFVMIYVVRILKTVIPLPARCKRFREIMMGNGGFLPAFAI